MFYVVNLRLFTKSVNFRYSINNFDVKTRKNHVNNTCNNQLLFTVKNKDINFLCGIYCNKTMFSLKKKQARNYHGSNYVFL